MNYDYELASKLRLLSPPQRSDLHIIENLFSSYSFIWTSYGNSVEFHWIARIRWLEMNATLTSQQKWTSLDFFFSLLFFFLLQRTSGGPKSHLPATSAANCCIASNTNLRFACPNAQSRKQRRTRDTRQIGHGHAYGYLKHKLRWMLLLREPTLHLQLQDEKKRKICGWRIVPLARPPTPQQLKPC